MAIIRDTLRPELERIKTELKALQALKIHVGIQGDADSYLLMIAGVHEYGATIRAKNVKNLAIPISREAEGKSPRDFQGLFFITSEEGHLFGVTDKGNGKFNFLFLLLPSVTIPERSFIRGSFDPREERTRGGLQGSHRQNCPRGGEPPERRQHSSASGRRP